MATFLFVQLCSVRLLSSKRSLKRHGVLQEVRSLAEKSFSEIPMPRILLVYVVQ